MSLANLIVLVGSAAVEAAARKAGHDITVPFTPGRTDASLEQKDVNSFEVLEPAADGLRTYVRAGAKDTVTKVIDKASLLTIRAPEMTALVGGSRALDANSGHTPQGVFTQRPGTLAPGFFINPLYMRTAWTKSEATPGIFIGTARKTGELAGRRPTQTLFSARMPSCARCRGLLCTGWGSALGAGFRGCVDQGNEPGSVRHDLPTGGLIRYRRGWPKHTEIGTLDDIFATVLSFPHDEA